VNHLDLFSGIGGFSLAASWVWKENHNIVSFVEIDPFCQKVLKKHWPDVPIHSDIRNYKHDKTTIDLLTGGPPCQPASCAGKRRGSEDDRWLWPETIRIVRESKPEWIIFENPTGFITLNNGMEFDKVLSQLETEGYETESFIIPACAIGARHIRDRVWILAHSNQEGLSQLKRQTEEQESWAGLNWSAVQNNWRKWNPYSSFLCRGVNGIPSRVDRLKSLGNAIVPAVVVPIMEAIKTEMEKGAE